MKLRFTKMQGAGNDFVVLDATAAPLSLSTEQLRRLGDRRFGVGADQILVVERSATPGMDFRYRIFNGASGDEVEHCGNGARCFVRFVHARGLSDKTTLQVETVNKQLELRLLADGSVQVDMNAPDFEHAALPFDAAGLQPRALGGFELWPLALGDGVGQALGARLVLVLVGERPGMSAPDSLGAYLTYAPVPGRLDAERNCVSNIRPEGLPPAQAGARLAWLVHAALRRGLSGVALKDDSASSLLAGGAAMADADAPPDRPV
jgi:hypothetical protein